ncbi:TPA: hypothetical protein ACHJ6T_004868, partial [Escherichia coli]
DLNTGVEDNHKKTCNSVHLRKGMYGCKPNGYWTVRAFRTAFTFSGYVIGRLMFSFYAETMHNILLMLSRFPYYLP